MGCSQVVRQWILTPSSEGSSPSIPVFLFFNLLFMRIEIQLIKGKKENKVPIIKLTKSLNGKTGTATFIFVNPHSFKDFFSINTPIKGVSLIYGTKLIYTSDLKIIFKNGQPFLLKSIFVFKNSLEWFHFLNFMNFYSKEKGLLFEGDIF